jgi:hypothetical protein
MMYSSARSARRLCLPWLRREQFECARSAMSEARAALEQKVGASCRRRVQSAARPELRIVCPARGRSKGGVNCWSAGFESVGPLAPLLSSIQTRYCGLRTAICRQRIVDLIRDHWSPARRRCTGLDPGNPAQLLQGNESALDLPCGVWLGPFSMCDLLRSELAWKALLEAL